MSEKPLMIESEPPSYFVAGSGQEYGVLDFDILGSAIDDARRVSAGIEVAPTDDAEVKALKELVVSLADTVTELAGQAYQVAYAVRAGRIAVIDNRG